MNANSFSICPIRTIQNGTANTPVIIATIPV
jgi:hypothetical protein